MTAAGGGPALHGAAAAGPAGGADGPGAGRFRAPRLRTVLGLARVEASLLIRSLLVLAGLLAGGVMIWLFIRSLQPLWWDASWEIGEGQLVLAMAVLAAAQLAAGRARRDTMSDLYASFPATARTRTLAHLTGLTGAALASLLLLAATAIVVQTRGAIGAPSITVLAGGVLLVIAAGAAGIAIGTRFSHPLAGVLGALVLLLTSWESQRFPGAVPWLLPWPSQSSQAGQLGELPGPLAGYPPGGAHAVELAGLALLAATVALAATTGRARTRVRGALAAAGTLGVAVICLAGAVQLRPIPTADLNHLVTETADPASVQHCTTAKAVRYCLYPGFGSDLPSLEAPVNGVLAYLPARPGQPGQPGQPLTVRQVVSLSLSDPVLTHGHPNRQVSQWQAQTQNAPDNAPTASAIYLPVGSWPATGGRLADAHFAVALAAAEWAVRIPSQAIGSPASEVYLPCVPLGQAREAIAIWLAILATHPPAGELQAGLPSQGFTGEEVRNTFVPVWAYPGGNAGYLAPSGSGQQPTAVGYLLAKAMTGLPERKVSQVLDGAWASWLNARTTDAQLATALGIRLPSVPLPPSLRPGFQRPPGMSTTGQPGPQSPVCTS